MKYNSLSELFKEIADAIRSKTGNADLIVANDFPRAIENINSDHSMEDALVMGILEHYVNDRVTKINERKDVSLFATPFWWSQETLKSVSMAKLESMPRDIFTGFSSLESVDFPSLKIVPVYAFDSCHCLKNINLPSVTVISANAFQGCDAIERLNLPNVTEIQDYALDFSNWWDFSTVIDLPKVTSIGEYAFPKYSNTHILLRGKTIPTLGGALTDDSFEGYVYVPRSLVDSYKVAENWSNYANQLRALEDYTIDGTVTGELDYNKINGNIAIQIDEILYIKSGNNVTLNGNILEVR